MAKPEKDASVFAHIETLVAEEHSLPLQTSVPGVFAIGDVRAGSVKRLGGAIGEGAAVVAQIHVFLSADRARGPLSRPTRDLARA